MANILPFNPLAYYTAPCIESVFWKPPQGMLLRPITVCGVVFPNVQHKTKYLPEWSKK